MRVRIEMIGQIFGRLTVISSAEDKKGQTRWWCQCQCRTMKSINGSKLRRGEITSCGCRNREVARSRIVNLVGLRFGRWLVTQRAPNHNNKPYWHCQCDCGHIKEVSGSSLTYRQTESCGCLSRERARQRKTTHGMGGRKGKTPEYRSWSAMINRCTNKNNDSFPWYGERGIQVCSYYRTSFPAFLDDLGPRPGGMKYSIDRKNSNSHYSCGHCEECVSKRWPANCRWATRKEQMLNTRRNHWMTHHGMTHTTSQWSELLGINRGTLQSRISRRLPVERILAPVISRVPK